MAQAPIVDPQLRMDFIEWMQDAVMQAEEDWVEMAEERYEITITQEMMDELFPAYFWDMARYYLADMSAYQFSEFKQQINKMKEL